MIVVNFSQRETVERRMKYIAYQEKIFNTVVLVNLVLKLFINRYIKMWFLIKCDT